MRVAPDPRILTGWSGASPHVLRFPPAGFPPVSRLPAGFSPFARLPRFPFVRRSPVRPLRPLPRFRFPFGVPPVSLPLSNLHGSAAEGRFRRRWSRAARAKVTSPATTTARLDLAVIRPALQMGNGWARGNVATESPVTSGRERRTPPHPNRPDRRLGERSLEPPQPLRVMQSVSRRASERGVNGETKTEPRPRLRGTARTWPRPAPATVSTSPGGVRLTPMTHHRARPSGRRTDVKPLLPEWRRECSRAQAAAPVLAWRCPALRRGLCRPMTVFGSGHFPESGPEPVFAVP
jgi:hypothetical protein